MIALAIALVFNFSMYWFSNRIAIATTRSKPVTEQEMPDYYRVVRELANEQKLPMPRLYVSDMMQPNAFATGRNPEHAAVAVTRGILQILDDESSEASSPTSSRTWRTATSSSPRSRPRSA